MNRDLLAVAHPWPKPPASRLQTAVAEAAADCYRRGYPMRHTIAVLLDWCSESDRPVPAEVVAAVVCETYVAADRAAVDRPVGTPFIDLWDRRDAVVAGREWLIRGFLPAAQRVAIVGRWGGGKSWTALDAALCVSSGTSFLGLQPPDQTGNVLILDGEGGSRRAINRFNALCNARRPNPEYRRRVSWRAASDMSLFEGAGLSRLTRELGALEPALIIFDTLAKVMGLPDENSNAAAARITGGLYRLNQELQSTILLLAHPSKSDTHGDSVRGAGELSADLDVLWTIRKEGSVHHLLCTKDRDADLERSRFAFSIRKDEGPPATTNLVRSIAHASLAPAHDAILDSLRAAPHGLTLGELATAVDSRCGAGRTTTHHLLKELQASGEVANLRRRWRILDIAESPVATRVWTRGMHRRRAAAKHRVVDAISAPGPVKAGAYGIRPPGAERT